MRFRKPITICHDLGHCQFAGGDHVTVIKGSQGKRGFLIDVGIRVTETFACDTTTAKVRLGSAAGPDRNAELVIADGTAEGDCFNSCNDRDAIKGPELTPEEQIEVTFVAPAGSGVAAGAGHVYAVIHWI